MVNDVIDTPATDDLNIENIENKPICPVCSGYLENADSGYEYQRSNPDTRWFYCPACEGHFGYHRMKQRWTVDPYDLNNSQAFREFFNVAALDED